MGFFCLFFFFFHGWVARDFVLLLLWVLFLGGGYIKYGFHDSVARVLKGVFSLFFGFCINERNLSSSYSCLQLR